MEIKRSALILLGGMATRAGNRPKYLFEYNGETFLSRQIQVLRQVTDEIILSCRDIEQTQDLLDYPAHKIVTDVRRAAGPSEGIRTGALAAQGEHIFIVACDMPLISPGVIEFLFASMGSAEVIIPGWEDGYLEPLHAVYRREALLRYFTESTSLKLRSITESLDTIIIPVQNIRSFDQALLSFTNINDLETLTKLKEIKKLN
ncbi:MAG: molybdenum cofactor guanylyltransferase [Methanomicrobiales archaeon HGW-Methanomicrobiales-4]|nr:MAG: molybdenum cofactor guanylyltransferase [Methanomicrobiales archaeon HGW-Methanomicrobiales-4]